MDDLYGEHHRLSTELGVNRRRPGGLVVVEGGGGKGGDEGWMGMDPVQWFQSSKMHVDLERREHILSSRPTPALHITAPPLTCASGLGNGDSAVPVACSPLVVHYNVSCAENL